MEAWIAAWHALQRTPWLKQRLQATGEFQAPDEYAVVKGVQEPIDPPHPKKDSAWRKFAVRVAVRFWGGQALDHPLNPFTPFWVDMPVHVFYNTFCTPPRPRLAADNAPVTLPCAFSLSFPDCRLEFLWACSDPEYGGDLIIPLDQWRHALETFDKGTPEDRHPLYVFKSWPEWHLNLGTLRYFRGKRCRNQLSGRYRLYEGRTPWSFEECMALRCVERQDLDGQWRELPGGMSLRSLSQPFKRLLKKSQILADPGPWMMEHLQACKHLNNGRVPPAAKQRNDGEEDMDPSVKDTTGEDEQEEEEGPPARRRRIEIPTSPLKKVVVRSLSTKQLAGLSLLVFTALLGRTEEYEPLIEEVSGRAIRVLREGGCTVEVGPSPQVDNRDEVVVSKGSERMSLDGCHPGLKLGEREPLPAEDFTLAL
jgi:hypothetical protein